MLTEPEVACDDVLRDVQPFDCGVLEHAGGSRRV